MPVGWNREAAGCAAVAAILMGLIATTVNLSSSGDGQADVRTESVLALRQYAAVGFDDLSVEDTKAMARLLAERSIVASLIDPFPYTEQAIGALADRLGQSQSRWRQGQSAGVTAAILAERLNEELDLDKGPEHLVIRPGHVNRARIRVWSFVPELRLADAGTERRGGWFFAEELSPLEAYMVAEMVIHRKLTDPSFAKTEDEERSVPFPPITSRAPGIYVVDLDPRLEEFREHVRSTASVKWSTAEDVLSRVPVLLEADHGR
jgi:hypothetical protein